MHYWDGQDIIAETTANGTFKARYLRANSQLVAEQIGTEMSYYLHNAHGDVVQRTDSSGGVLKSYHYDSFGNIINPATAGDPNEPIYTDQSPFGYCGEYLDKETGEIYLRARYYDSASGRFTAEDPKHWSTHKLTEEQEAIIPASLNSYTYSYNDPVQYVDKDGKVVTLAALGAGAIAGAIYGLASVLISDLASGTWSSLNTYASEMIGGAVGGAVLVGFKSSAAAAGTQAVVTNAVYQGLQVATGKQKEVDWDNLITETATDFAVNWYSYSFAPKVFPRGPGRDPKYLKTWLFEKVGRNVLWRQGALAAFAQVWIEKTADTTISSWQASRAEDQRWAAASDGWQAPIPAGLPKQYVNMYLAAMQLLHWAMMLMRALAAVNAAVKSSK